MGKAGGAERLTGLRSARGWTMPDPWMVEWERVLSAHPTRCIYVADAVPALAGTAQKRRGGGLRCGVYRTTRAAWNTTAGVQVQVFVVL